MMKQQEPMIPIQTTDKNTHKSVNQLVTSIFNAIVKSVLLCLCLLALAVQSSGQAVDKNPNTRVVVITGARFAYPLVQKWIDDYYKVNPSVQIIIESRGTNDPNQYDVLIEAYPQDEAVQKTRDYTHVARYAILPVANNQSAFARYYQDKGLNQNLINQLFFHDIFVDKKDEQKIKYPYNIYTRLQKAGAPIVFAKYFGYEQKDIRGKAIAGADEHLLKAILRDSVGVSTLPLSLVYDRTSRKAVSGITVLPIDLNGNGRINDDEKFYGDLDQVLQKLEEKDSKDFKNVPIGYLHFSVDKKNSKPEALDFLQWVAAHGQSDLHDFGYLKVDGNALARQSVER
jgi:phosphate transport system substrate-binding protein